MNHRDGVESAVRAFRAGQPVLIHDAEDREGETDLCYPAAAVAAADVARLRNDAGGLICVALSHDVADAFELPFLHQALDHPITRHEPSYDDRPSFSLSVNHRDTRTGITDRDRAKTIRALADAAAAPASFPFQTRFRAPGHVHLLRAADGLLATREGHTELSVALARWAELPPATVVCEMLDDETGEALPPSAARRYAEKTGLVYLEGSAVRDRTEPVVGPDPQHT